MLYNDDLRQDMPYGLDNDIDINITNQNVNANMNDNMNFNEMGGYAMPMQPQMGSVMSPIIEPGRERVLNRTFIHEVPQDYPFMSYELMINKYKLKSYYEIVLLS